jgi:hypothetical protein
VKLEEFMAEPSPYAILFYTWEEGEVAFQASTSPDCTALSTRKSITKILYTFHIENQTGIAYVWIDTSCTDKTSSSQPATVPVFLKRLHTLRNDAAARIESNTSNLTAYRIVGVCKLCKDCKRIWV